MKGRVLALRPPDSAGIATPERKRLARIGALAALNGDVFSVVETSKEPYRLRSFASGIERCYGDLAHLEAALEQMQRGSRWST